jgi:uncharacterized protein YdeI (YjbR/CyaY-like superfamily)
MNTIPNPGVDAYLTTGCGRCSLFNTPQCKVHRWPAILTRLRGILLESPLTEEVKWGVPCYTWQGGNVILLSALNDCCTLSFLKGALLPDPQGLLQKPGPNTQAARLLRFTAVEEVGAIESALRTFIGQALEVEKAGLRVETPRNPEPIPEQLQHKLDELPALREAFFALTPGRQRAYILYFSDPKQIKTRFARIEKCLPQILAGKGLHE